MKAMKIKPAKRIGRPSGYKPEYCRIVQAMCELGATMPEVADALGITLATLYRWRISFPAFCEALKVGKEPADDAVEASLLKRAQGYDVVVEDVRVVGGKIKKVNVIKHIPPDPTSMIFWLKNRRRSEWRNADWRSEQEAPALEDPDPGV